MPRNFLAFCEDNGNYFTINEQGEVGYFDHNEDRHILEHNEFKDWVLEWLEVTKNS